LRCVCDRPRTNNPHAGRLAILVQTRAFRAALVSFGSVSVDHAWQQAASDRFAEQFGRTNASPTSSNRTAASMTSVRVASTDGGRRPGQQDFGELSKAAFFSFASENGVLGALDRFRAAVGDMRNSVSSAARPLKTYRILGACVGRSTHRGRIETVWSLAKIETRSRCFGGKPARFETSPLSPPDVLSRP